MFQWKLCLPRYILARNMRTVMWMKEKVMVLVYPTVQRTKVCSDSQALHLLSLLVT